MAGNAFGFAIGRPCERGRLWKNGWCSSFRTSVSTRLAAIDPIIGD
ncbi:hypothetical protein [Streptomyces sp. PT12]|nr:hypothetical protein [Streptomyces sp. PT12]